MSRVWTSEELARECKNCEVASAGRIRSQAETISQLRETIALMSRERSKMREALEQIHELLGIGGKLDTAMCIRYEAAYKIAEEALAAHLRNCDDLEVCGDYDESAEARREEREAHEVDKADAKRKGEW